MSSPAPTSSRSPAARSAKAPRTSSKSTPSKKASAPPTSSWPPPKAPRPASSSRSRSVRWCSHSSPSSRSPTACLVVRRLVRLSRPQLPGRVVGTLFSPVMYLIGVPWNEAGVAGGLFGTKIMLNEFVAFIDLGNAAGPAAALTERSRAIVTFALCGFANFSSIAIQMAVTGNLAPNQRPMIAKLGPRALLAGSLANLMSAALAGLMIAVEDVFDDVACTISVGHGAGRQGAARSLRPARRHGRGWPRGNRRRPTDGRFRGRINRCDITESSGQAILDATTCSILTRRARFDPARDEAGAPVEGKVAGKIEWKVPR